MTDLEMKLVAAVKAGVTMRAAQVAYYKNRRSDMLVAAKQAEAAWDRIATAVLTEAKADAT